jgi:transcriptional regulator with XRE-family HTH domain
MESASNIVVRIRKATGLTQEDFGIKLGVSKAYISNMESGYKVPSDRILLKIEQISGERILDSIVKRASAFLSDNPSDDEFKEFIERELQH